jgi:hypothetical protein
MPITPCFDPTTGASGGAPAPAPPPRLYNHPMTELDHTDGSWTLLDPDGMVDTVSFAGGYNTVTFNAAVATSNHRWVNTTVFTAPRWYKSMQIDGNQVTLEDPSWFVCRMENDLTVNDFDQQNIFCSAADPTSTDPTVMGAAGGLWAKAVAGNPDYGVLSTNTATSAVSFNSVYAHAAVMQGGRSNGSNTFIHYNSGNTAERAGSRNTAILNQAGTDRYIMVGLGSTVAINAGDQVKFSLKYLALTFAGL